MRIEPDIVIRMSRRWTTVVALVGLLAGCSSTLETGYKPRKIGASGVQRRSYYASPFTPEDRAAEMQRVQESQGGKPMPGY